MDEFTVLEPVPVPLSIPDHGRRFVVADEDGDLYAVFVQDAAGRLIFRPEPPGDEAFGPAAVAVAFRDELDWPEPWHWAQQAFMRDLQRWFGQAPPALADRCGQLYPQGAPADVDALFVPAIPAGESRQDPAELRAVIDAIERAPAIEGRVRQALCRLADLGVVRLPARGTFDRRYHEAVEGQPRPGDPVDRLGHAYGYDRAVLRPAPVRPAVHAGQETEVRHEAP